jgi:hypothetical protein
MTKKEQAQSVTVLLRCVYSGHPDSPGPGQLVTVNAAEAARLIELGAADAVPGAGGK